MQPQRNLFGRERSAVVTVDGLPIDCAALIEAAATMAPFPAPQRIYYPGLRRIFDEADEAAWRLTRNLLETCAPFIAGGFDCDGFELVEASFSLVTTPPDALASGQRHPHFDSTDPDFVALILYLFDPGEGEGTAFYRHCGTGIEVVTPANCDRFVAAVQAEAPTLSGYFAPGDRGFEEIGRVEARYGRAGIWRGNVLHSGLIPPDCSFSPDPREGRLTLNLFLRLTRAPA